nr:nucleotide-binding alpha-beta plait domain-containing protein [Tanacetum cinerariifolium]
MTNSYAHVVKENQVQNVGMEECPNMVLDETCLNHEDFSLCLLRKVKEFASLTNLKVVLGKEEYANFELKHMGGFWVMIVFQDDETRKKFQFNLAVGSWFSQIIQAHNDFVIDERVIWVEVEGIPCKWWSRNTFSRIASRWGTLLNGEELEEEGYHSNKICIRKKLKTVVFDSFKMDGEEGYDVNDGSHEDDMYGGVLGNLKDVKCESDREEVSETNFEEVPDKSIFEGNSVRQNDVHSEDPFGIYEVLNKKRDGKNIDDKHEDGLKYPPGFTPNEKGDVHVEKVDNWSDENRVNDGQEDG